MTRHTELSTLRSRASLDDLDPFEADDLADIDPTTDDDPGSAWFTALLDGRDLSDDHEENTDDE